MPTAVETKVDTFFSNFPLQQLSKGKTLLQPEDNPAGAYYLKTGHVKMYYISPQGIEITIHIFNPHSFFPMTWVLNGIPNRYHYEAFTDIEVYRAPKEKVLTFLKNEPDVLFDLTKRIFMGLDKLTMRIEHMAYSTSHDKVVSILIYIARHFEQKFTHHDIGSLAGISRETTSRVLGKLKAKRITVDDVKKLENELM